MVTVSDCSCPSVVGEWGIEWPQTQQASMVTKPCSEGYTGQVVMWCSQTCSWNIIEGNCSPNICPDELAENVLWTAEQTDGIQVHYCENKRDIAMSRHCGKDGLWDPVEYGSCTCPEGDLDGLQWPRGYSNQYSYLSCPVGYSGHIARRCDRFGRWMPAINECSVKHCPATEIDDQGIPESIAGTKFILHCKMPLAGYSEILCLENGQWSIVSDHCRPMNCDPFLTGDITSKLVHFLYKGPENVTRTEIELVPRGNEIYHFYQQRAYVKGFDPRRTVDIILRTFSLKETEEYVSTLCVFQSTQMGLVCKDMEAPSVKKLRLDKNGKAKLTVSFLYPLCRIESVPSLNLRVITVGPCSVQDDYILHLNCSDLGSNCRTGSVGSYTLGNSLRQECTYSIAVEIVTPEEESHHWSPALLVSPGQACTTWTPLVSIIAITTQAIQISWTIQTDSSQFFLQSISLRKRLRTATKQTRKKEWEKTPSIIVCDGESTCWGQNSTLVSLEQAGMAYEFELVFEAGSVFCQSTQTVVTQYNAPKRPTVSLQYEVFDTYLILTPQNVSVVSQLTCSLQNTLGEAVTSRSISVYPDKEPTPFYLNRLNPNSRYTLIWKVEDTIAAFTQQSLTIATRPLRKARLNGKIVTISLTHVTLRFQPYSEGMLVCLPSSQSFEEKPRYVQANGIHLRVIVPEEMVVVTLPVKPTDTMINCLQMDKTESFALSSVEVISYKPSTGTE